MCSYWKFSIIFYNFDLIFLGLLFGLGIISCAFIVFSGCMVELQSDNFETLFTVLVGAGKSYLFNCYIHQHIDLKCNQEYI